MHSLFSSAIVQNVEVKYVQEAMYGYSREVIKDINPWLAL